MWLPWIIVAWCLVAVVWAIHAGRIVGSRRRYRATMLWLEEEFQRHLAAALAVPVVVQDLMVGDVAFLIRSAAPHPNHPQIDLRNYIGNVLQVTRKDDDSGLYAVRLVPHGPEFWATRDMLQPVRRDVAAVMMRNEEIGKRSIDLMKAWLSPAQLKQFERHRSFEVTGSRGGWYLIEEGSTFNVAARGFGRICFVPKGALAFGDVMLAQKIMLESDEGAVLKIAKKADRALVMEAVDRIVRFDAPI
jgi:hypothetical protein